MPNTNFQTLHQMGGAINSFVKQATGRDNMQNIDMEHITVAQNHYYDDVDISGRVVSFNAGAAGIPLDKCLVQIEPVQDLHGYDHPWPAGGGKNIGYLSATNIYSEQRNTNTYVNNGVVVTGVGAYARCGFSIPVVTGETYTVSAKCKRGSTSVQRIGLSDNTGWSYTYGVLDVLSETLSTLSKTITATSDTLCIEVYPGSDGAVITIEDFQVEKNSSATSFSPYSNICPITGWTMVNVYQAGQNMEDARVYRFTFPSEAGTVYGGTLDVISGVLTVTHANIASYNGEPLSGRWISSMDVYSASGTPTIGAQVVYELATPLTHQLTPQEVKTRRGTNNVWADTGDIEVKFKNIKEFF